MSKSTPKAILNFLHDKFSLISDLFECNKIDNLLKAEIVEQLCRNNDIKIDALLKHGIIRELRSNYELNSYFSDFMSFLLDDYKLDLPSSIQKHTDSIDDIFLSLQRENEVNKIIKYIDGLVREIQEFNRKIETNTNKLLDETTDLKANLEKIEYSAKVKQASLWIDFYIKPLNDILSKEHPNSMINQLGRISAYAYQQKSEFYDFNLRRQFETLYDHTLSANDHLLNHSQRLTKELLPLLETIQYEHPILSRLIEFIKHPDDYNCFLPNLISGSKYSILSTSFEGDALSIIALTQNREPIIIYEETEFEQPWLFDKEKYKNMLIKDMPVDNFFQWCYSTLLQEHQTINLEKFYALTSLLFEKEFDAEFYDYEKFPLFLEDYTIFSPTINLRYLD